MFMSRLQPSNNVMRLLASYVASKMVYFFLKKLDKACQYE